MYRTIGWAAGLLAVAAVSAHAAESKAKTQSWPADNEAAHTVTGCEYMGEGYVKMPGTDTCIRVSGYVRSEGAILSR